jgi:hypothetical protein
MHFLQSFVLVKAAQRPLRLRIFVEEEAAAIGVRDGCYVPDRRIEEHRTVGAPSLESRFECEQEDPRAVRLTSLVVLRGTSYLIKQGLFSSIQTVLNKRCPS